MRVLWISCLIPMIMVQPSNAQEPPTLTARVVAVGIPGASAVAPVGFFHPGGPIHDNAAFAAFTQPGRVLDRKRVLVTSNSNFGAPRALAKAAEGSVLSLDPDGDTLVVPSDFALAGNQAAAHGGRVQLFAAQSAAFLNSVRTPGAMSAVYPTVSNPLGISINNAFGRLWFSNAPQGAAGIGTESIADPTGEPLANAPSKLLGGVFAGDITNRPQQIVPGALNAGAVATALLGASPDGSKRAVFAVLTADGALAQAHTEFALDGLAPAGTVSPIAIANASDGRVTRAGMIFNWVPDRILYVTEADRNAIAALTLTTDDKVFRVASSRRFTAPQFNVPIDLAPVVPEVANPGFSSNTTLAGNSDIYVANRGNGTIVRVKQDGTVVAVRRVALPDGRRLGPGRLNGIAVSPDAQKIWITISGALPDQPGAPGALLEVPAFGPERAEVQQATRFAALESGRSDLIEHGAKLFRAEFTPAQGLGPLFNAPSCVACHRTPTVGGMGVEGLAVVSCVGTFHSGSFDPLVGRGGPVARAHSIAELGIPCDLAHGPPAAANLVSVCNAPALYGLGLVDSIPDDVIRAGAMARDAVNGRVHAVTDAQGRVRVGRFGWKADVATLEQFVGEAFRNELGITNPLAPVDLVASTGCGGAAAALDDDGTIVRAVTAYIAALPRPSPTAGAQDQRGQELFTAAGCAACHTPTLASAVGDVPLYSDLLLHDLGPALADGVVQGDANDREWRTTPLWGLGIRSRFLHDGRATNLRDAILAHDGEAAASAKAFRKLAPDDQTALMAFVSGL